MFMDEKSIVTGKQTSYNTYGNVHYAPSPPAEPHTPDGGTPVRANYAGIGYTYDPIDDAFIPPMPDCNHDSILLNAHKRWECSSCDEADSL